MTTFKETVFSSAEWTILSVENAAQKCTQNIYLKFIITSRSYHLLLTDLTDVYYSEANEMKIKAEKNLYAGAVTLKSSEIMSRIEDVLRGKTSNTKFELQFLKDECILTLNQQFDSSFNFRWLFHFSSLGAEAGAVLKNQLITPLLFATNEMNHLVTTLGQKVAELTTLLRMKGIQGIPPFILEEFVESRFEEETLRDSIENPPVFNFYSVAGKAFHSYVSLLSEKTFKEQKKQEEKRSFTETTSIHPTATSLSQTEPIELPPSLPEASLSATIPLIQPSDTIPIPPAPELHFPSDAKQAESPAKKSSSAKNHPAAATPEVDSASREYEQVLKRRREVEAQLAVDSQQKKAKIDKKKKKKFV